jgi:hypothetical protein
MGSLAPLSALAFLLGLGCHKAVPLYDSCTDDGACAPGFCQKSVAVADGRQFGFCTKHCAGDDSSCTGGGSCRPGPSGGSICAPPCEQDESGIFACVGGQVTFCSQLAGKHCETCGCPSDLRCDPDQGCVPKSDVGGPCRKDDDCQTRNCSTFAHVCRVAVGAACTTENCDTCRTSDPAKLPWTYSYCSRDCSDDRECHGGVCLSFGDGWRTCYGTCQDATPGPGNCPNACRATQSRTWAVLYCDCPSCFTSFAPRPDGTSCHFDSQCAGGKCLRVSDCSYSMCDATYGRCARSCDASTPCSSGFECIDLPCPVNSDPSSCGMRCLPTCDGTCSGGTCRPLPSTRGDAVMVCDIRSADGSACKRDGDCQSGRCAASVCAPASGAPNGWRCAKHADCASGSCVNGACQG